MLLTLDVGNTNTVLGVFRGPKLVANWRLTTARDQTIDEYGILTRDLFTLAKLGSKEIDGIIISSVVPPLKRDSGRNGGTIFPARRDVREPWNQDRDAGEIRQTPRSGSGPHREQRGGASQSMVGRALLWISGRRSISMRFLRKASIWAAFCAQELEFRPRRFSRALLGCSAWRSKTPGQVIGTNTVASMQSGLFYGYTDLVDGILERMKKVLGAKDDGGGDGRTSAC